MNKYDMENQLKLPVDRTLPHWFRKNTRVVSVLSLILVTGCATLDKSECAEGNWQEIGYEDGNTGLVSAARLAKHRKACGKYGVSPDVAAYQTGYTDGVNNFCRASGGLRLGKAGYAYDDVCPVELESKFLTSYVSGLKDHLEDLENEEDRLKAALENKRETYYVLKDADVEGKPLKEAQGEIESAKTAVDLNKVEQDRVNEMIAQWSAEI